MNKPKKQKYTKVQKWTIGVGIFVIAYIISLFLPLISPYTKYPIYFVKCGGQPIEASNFMAGNRYTVPGTKDYRVDGFSDYYFCSEDEAEVAGFSKT